ncbi:NnrS family protein [Bdellovibrio bacteriovorus]|uniref:NnrS family protein n=1 Tax=Bdellovibrio bacteriovorus TaxID=959 RepID=UPI0035A5AC6D
MEQNQLDAYRIFFPAGWLLSIWGVVLWILFPWKLVNYPGFSHPEIMMGGFFLCFVCGFLMTAVPRFTNTFGPTRAEQNFSFIAIAGLFASLLVSQKAAFYGAVLLCLFFLVFYSARRFLQRKSNPPDSFIFVAAGLLSAIAGTFILFLAELVNLPSDLYSLGRSLFLQCYIMCLILGVGSRLIPALLGWGPLPTEMHRTSRQVWLFAGLSFFFVLSYFCESQGHTLGAALLRAAIVTLICFKFWKLHKFPQRRGVQTWGLWSSAWSLLLAFWALVFLPSFRIHILHIVYASGMGLMTFMIAVRVILSHGKHSMILEKSSKLLGLGAFLLFFAGLTRFSAGLAPHIYQSHLLYAAVTWIAGALVWGWVFLPKIFHVGPSHDKSV